LSAVCILFAGGGTGGHVYPALAVADELRRLRPDVRVDFVGTRHRIESQLVPDRGYGFHAITVSGFRRSLSLAALVAPVKMMVALVQSVLLLRRLRPAVVVGTGGYVSGPPVAAAWMLGVPRLVQEQNSIPGVTTRLLARIATEVHVSFPVTERYLGRTRHLRLTGTPTREGIGRVSRTEAAKNLGLEAQRATVLVMGGSQGARSLNDAILATLPALLDRSVQLIWATGPSDGRRVEAAVQQLVPSGDASVRVVPYIEQMEDAYAVADLAVARAGATTVAELLCAGLPAVLVPYPHAADDHQTENARAVVEAGAGLMVRDAELLERLGGELLGLLGDPQRRRTMAERARAMAHPEAARRLAEAVLHLAE